jgi:hypothetical protein
MSVLYIIGTLGIPAAVAAIVTALINYRGGLRTVYMKYELEQQRELRALMGRYTGRMLEAAIDWDRRMMQLYDNVEKAAGKAPGDDRDFYWHLMCPGWGKRLKSEEDGSAEAVARYRRDPHEYFYLSVVFRFLSLLAIARRFEAQAFYIDARHVKNHRNELYFLRYAKSFLWAMTYSELSPDDGFPGDDHFLSDKFRPMLDLCYKEPGRSGSKAPQGQPIFDWPRFLVLLHRKSSDDREEFDPAIDQVLAFFDELRPVDYREGRKRRRWERLICLHLLTLNFIATFGYPWQRNITDRRAKAIEFLSMDNTVIQAFLEGSEDWLGLEDQDLMKSLKEALRSAVEESRTAVSDDDLTARAVARLMYMGAKEAEEGTEPTDLCDQAKNQFSVDQKWLECIGWRVASMITSRPYRRTLSGRGYEPKADHVGRAPDGN